MDEIKFELVKLNSRKFAIYCQPSRCYVYGKKKNLVKLLKEIKELERNGYRIYPEKEPDWNAE